MEYHMYSELCTRINELLEENFYLRLFIRNMKIEDIKAIMKQHPNYNKKWFEIIFERK